MYTMHLHQSATIAVSNDQSGLRELSLEASYRKSGPALFEDDLDTGFAHDPFDAMIAYEDVRRLLT